MSFNVEEIRAQFPFFKTHEALAYLDTAATALKPFPVTKVLTDYYQHESVNVHRGAYALSDKVTSGFEDARAEVARFLNADTREIVFTRNTTEAINLVAHSWGRRNLKKGDRVLITEMEHHANIVPWQILQEERELFIDVVRMTDEGRLDQKHFEELLNNKPKIVAMTGCSNVLGTFTDIAKAAKLAHAAGAVILVDGAQLVSQKRLDMRALDLDFFVFSAHKLFGPTGIGVLYGKESLLSAMPPWQGGGSMISEVRFEKTTFNDIPFRFEAGTPNIAGVLATGAALKWFGALPIAEVAAYEHQLLEQATKGLREIPKVKIYADIQDKAAILAFNIEGAHHSDVAQILDQKGVAVRAGHMCAQPLMRRLGVPGVVRAAFSLYNRPEDVEKLLAGVRKAKEMLL